MTIRRLTEQKQGHNIGGREGEVGKERACNCVRLLCHGFLLRRPEHAFLSFTGKVLFLAIRSWWAPSLYSLSDFQFTCSSCRRRHLNKEWKVGAGRFCSLQMTFCEREHGTKTDSKGDLIVSMAEKVERSIKGAPVCWTLVCITQWLEQTSFSLSSWGPLLSPACRTRPCHSRRPHSVSPSSKAWFHVVQLTWGVWKLVEFPSLLGISDFKAPTSNQTKAKTICKTHSVQGWGTDAGPLCQ